MMSIIFHKCTSSLAKKPQEFVVIANNSIDKTATVTYLLSLMDKLESIVASPLVKALPQQSKTRKIIMFPCKEERPWHTCVTSSYFSLL